ncbi:putative endonuclease LCL3 [Choanephora cucurbitarum]|uniref:Putative endonuclease LCL3 n=1 Tax=Choanephora cucurbitarum TaxID=101091 RepID=A0A1C7N6F8_9FUNG|nr:putative endonuclease LCL3 [Choanephora cucurbitarum]
MANNSDFWTQVQQLFRNEKNDFWTDLKQRIEREKPSWDQRADELVQSLWRPITLGLLIGLPALYFANKVLIGRRFKTAEHIPPEAFERSQTIRGRVVAVGDSDNFRLYHTPGFGWGWARQVPKTKKELQKQTISVRIAGVDAPEGAHFGMPAQPYSKEAKAFLTDLVLNQKVRLQLLSRDQYGRVVGMAYVRRPPFYFEKNVSAEMLKAGLASIYTAKGAQYGGVFEKLKRYEARAKFFKRGIWSLQFYISPGDHKAKFLSGKSKS